MPTLTMLSSEGPLTTKNTAVNKKKCSWKERVSRLCLRKYDCVSLSIVFTTSQFSSISPVLRLPPQNSPVIPPLLSSLSCFSKPPHSRLGVYIFGIVWYEIIAATNHIAKKIITIVIIMLGSYSLEKGMVYYLAGSSVTDHYSLSHTLLVPLSFPLAQSPLVTSIIHVHSDSKPQTQHYYTAVRVYDMFV